MPTQKTFRVEVAVAAPVRRALTYALPPELVSLVRPLTRLLVPLRGGSKLGFALGAPAEGDGRGLKTVLDVLDDPDSPCLPPELLGFFTRAAAYYQTPLGQALAWALPAGLGSSKEWKTGAPRRGLVAVAAFRAGDQSRPPAPESQAACLLRHLQRQGPQPLPELRRRWPRATALVRRLEASGWVSLSHRPLVRDILGRPLLPEPRPERLTPDQEAALAVLAPAVEQRAFKPFLLYGVTGSGKTEIYLAAMEKALSLGRQGLILTPEIGLCLRLEGLLRSRFGPDVTAVLHSGLSPADRRGQWRDIAAGRARVVLGARSAVFAPLSDPGVICVDEEQDEAYKQEDRWRYNARDLALLRGQEQSCPVILGSATPAATTWRRAQDGEIGLLELPRRVGGSQMPRMEVVDLRSAGPLAGGFMSARLHQALRRVVAQGAQAIIFLNRRGYAPALLCPACGKTVGCPACSVSLTLHQARGKLICHTCGHERPAPERCPLCGAPGDQMKPLGLGTEAVAARLAELEPEMRIIRLDRDAAQSPAKLRAVLKRVAEHEVDVVVGTQMITKGHHFPRIRLVGVLLADQALATPDFRAAERAFTLLTQVAGRAGREDGPGLVVVQTYDPHHHALRAALNQDPREFYAEELEERRALGYPPFQRLMALRLDGAAEAAVRLAAENLGRCLDQARGRLELEAQVLGPAPAAIARAGGRFRYLLLLKTPGASAASRILRLGLHLAGPMPAGVRLAVDVDPLSLV